MAEMSGQQLACSDALTIAILAGGKSSRMGVDKGSTSCCDLPMVSHIIKRLAGLTDSIYIVTNEADRYSFSGMQVFSDVLPGNGALGGLYSALHYAETEYVAVIACDMVFANPAIMLEGLKRLDASGSDVAIPKSGQQYYEPLHALYRRKTCRQAVLEALSQDQRRLIGWLSAVRVEEIDEATCQRLDPSGMAFFNINTPEDKAAAEAYLMAQEKSSFDN